MRKSVSDLTDFHTVSLCEIHVHVFNDVRGLCHTLICIYLTICFFESNIFF